MKKELKKIAEALEDQGFGTAETKDHHLVAFSRDGRRIAVFSGTPSDHRSWANALADCKREGFQWPVPSKKERRAQERRERREDT